jgi:hypothetical protein
MKLVTLAFLMLASFGLQAAPECTTQAQQKIDSLLSQIASTADEIKKIDLEFEVRTIAYDFKDCRKQPIQRDIASLDVIEVTTME